MLVILANRERGRRNVLETPPPQHKYSEANVKILDVPQTGTLGTTVSYQHRTGLCQRQLIIPRDPKTEPQMLRRKAFESAAQLWNSLTDAQYSAWRTMAFSIRTNTRLNLSASLTAQLLFSKLNCNLAAIGLPMVPDPPALPEFGPNPVSGLSITNLAGAIALKLNLSAPLTQTVLVWGAKPRGSGARYVDHFTLLGLLPAPTLGQCDLTQLYIDKYGPPRPGSRVFIETLQQSNGWQDLPQRLSARVPNP